MVNSEPQPTYADAMTLPEALGEFFTRGNLGPDGGYSARWVRVETRPIAVYFPNTACRVEAAKLHDLHHIATGYDVDWNGEAEIAAWELAGGCGRYGWAWLLNLGAFMVGLVKCPRRLWRAFVRGRAAHNLYRRGFPEEQLHATCVAELRRLLALEEPMPAPSLRTRAAFAGMAALAIGWHALFVVAGVLVIWGAWRLVGSWA